MVTSSAVVGSSAMSSAGRQESAMRDHHALAHAAGELMRIGVEPPRRLGNAEKLEHLLGARERRRAPAHRPWKRIASMICSPTV